MDELAKATVSASESSDPRLAAARVLTQVLEGQTLEVALTPVLTKVAERDRGLLSECCYGVLRHYPGLDWLLDQLLRRPLKRREQLLRMLLLVGLYQCRDLRVPDYAAVSSTVEAVRRLGKPWAVSMANGVLRSFLRQRESLLARLDADTLARTDHPGWMVARFQEDWPAHWSRLVAANNTRPPMVLRVNRRRIDPADYQAMLTQQGIVATALAGLDGALELEQPRDVTTLPGFAQGLVSVQDGGAQLAAQWLAPLPGQRVLDACAAPGGKTCHLLESHEFAELVALDIDAERLGRVRDNLQRLGLRARVVHGDLLDARRWWDGRPFERILLDAPCSGSGVIRRHPDIKLLRRATDMAALADRQAALLTQAWELLAPGGHLLYATCSVFRAENVAVAGEFLERVGAQELPLPGDWGEPQEVGLQLLPGTDRTDGFYYARMVKPPRMVKPH